MILHLISIVIMYVIGLEMRFYVPIHCRSHLKKQSRDPDVVGRVQNGTCQASEKM